MQRRRQISHRPSIAPKEALLAGCPTRQPKQQAGDSEAMGQESGRAADKYIYNTYDLSPRPFSHDLEPLTNLHPTFKTRPSRKLTTVSPLFISLVRPQLSFL